MEHIFKPLIFFSIYFAISYAAKDSLQNPDFEIPPPNINLNNATSQKWLLTSLPGWSLNGTAWYVGNSSLLDVEGHAVQLGRNGKINQTFTATGTNNDVLHYVLSFTLASQNIGCANNRTSLNVTIRDVRYRNVSRVFYLQEKSRESRALFLGQLGRKDYVHIEIESVDTTSRDNVNTTCWPLVDAFSIKRNEQPSWYNGNMLSNGGFEVGPTFLKNSPNGIILNEEEEEENDSPLQQWSVLGTIRYVDSRHYKVPRGEAAVELLMGGVKADSTILQSKNFYTLNFTIGDTNDSCIADFVVYVQVESRMYNFTMKSNGKGSAFKQSLKFRVEEQSPWKTSTISFYSFEETRTRDGVMCGPVLDDIFLTGSESSSGSDSYGGRVQVYSRVLAVSLVFAFVTMIIVL